jgi:signal transduction histidine kinase
MGWGEAHMTLVEVDGKKREVLTVLREITERKRMEEEMQKQSEHLENLVEEKTLELLDAERMVTAGRFASMVGHDLKSPLQTIRNAAHLLREVPERKDEMLDMIENSVMRADKLIEDFRSNVRDLPLSLETQNLGSLLKAVVEEAGIPDSVTKSLKVGDGLEAVTFDLFKMRRVLENLIGNAVEAMPKGGVLKITADRREKEVIIEVTDTGVGTPEEEMQDLFKPFHTTKLKGLGLGLTFCKRAVDAHGGTITVESQVGEGSTFTVRIPLKAV